MWLNIQNVNNVDEIHHGITGLTEEALETCDDTDGIKIAMHSLYYTIENYSLCRRVSNSILGHRVSSSILGLLIYDVPPVINNINLANTTTLGYLIEKACSLTMRGSRRRVT